MNCANPAGRPRLAHPESRYCCICEAEHALIRIRTQGQTWETISPREAADYLRATPYGVITFTDQDGWGKGGREFTPQWPLREGEAFVAWAHSLCSAWAQC